MAVSDAALSARIAQQEQEIASLCREVIDRYEEATCVYRLSERIGSVLGERPIAKLVLDDAAAVLGAHAGQIWLKSDSGLALAASMTPGAADEPGAAVLEVIADGRATAHDGAVGAEAWAAVPLPDDTGAALGVLLLHGRPEGRGYLTGEIKLLGAIAAVTAAFIRNERLAEKARLVEARRREDEIARQVHRGLLPREDPLFAGLEISGGFRAAEIVGGDYYGYVAMADGSLGVAIADVSGHRVGAALYMATARGALHAEARDLLAPADVLRRVNEVLATDFSAADMFATLVFARFLPDGRRLIWSNAGHNPPLVLRRGGEIETLKPCGPALGIVAGARWRDVDCRFEPGDLLLLYTDGVVEARNAEGLFFGVEPLIEAARLPARSAAEIRGNVLDALARHTGSLPPQDDVTLVVIRGTAIEEEP
jgi:serine phosphatase RsbU (regulator of sigma subunit)